MSGVQAAAAVLYYVLLAACVLRLCGCVAVQLCCCAAVPLRCCVLLRCALSLKHPKWTHQNACKWCAKW